MSLPDRILPRSIRIPVLFISMLLLFSLAQGDENAQGTKEPTSKKTPLAAETTAHLDDEIARARGNVKEDPSNASLHVRLADLLTRQGMLDDALLSFDEALKLNPRSYEAKTGRGSVLARKGDLKGAELALKDALILNPNPVRTHYELGLVYERLGDLEKAITEFKEGIKKHEQGRR